MCRHKFKSWTDSISTFLSHHTIDTIYNFYIHLLILVYSYPTHKQHHQGDKADRQPHCQGHPNVLQWLQEIQPGFQQRLLGEKCSGYRKWYRGNWRIWGVTSGSHHFRCRGGKQKDQGLFHPLRWVLNLVKKCQQWQEDGMIIPLVHQYTTKTTSSTRITVVCNSKRPKSLKQSLKLRTSSRTNVLL